MVSHCGVDVNFSDDLQHLNFLMRLKNVWALQLIWLMVCSLVIFLSYREAEILCVVFT